MLKAASNFKKKVLEGAQGIAKKIPINNEGEVLADRIPNKYFGEGMKAKVGSGVKSKKMRPASSIGPQIKQRMMNKMYPKG